MIADSLMVALCSLCYFAIMAWNMTFFAASGMDASPRAALAFSLSLPCLLCYITNSWLIQAPIPLPRELSHIAEPSTDHFEVVMSRFTVLKRGSPSYGTYTRNDLHGGLASFSSGWDSGEVHNLGLLPDLGVER